MIKYFKIKIAALYFVLISLVFTENSLGSEIEPIIVTANPLSRSMDKVAQPVTILKGDDFLRKMQPTIGETLSQELGIRSTNFGPNSSRPIIRGLEGDQIQVLQNGIGNIDASAVSLDHNVAVDALSIERIEVIRGPASLLYGSKAVGGAVNLIDNRIPDEIISEKITGVADARFNSANKERSGSLLLEGGVDNYAWHINSFKRKTDDLKIPGYARSSRLREEDPIAFGENEDKNKLDNTQSSTQGTSVGLSKFFDKGYFGASFTNYNSNYGVLGHAHNEHEEGHAEDENGHDEEDEHAAEQDVIIKMKQQRLDFAGAYKKPIESVKEVKFKLGLSNYEHTEFEGDNIGTKFKNRGYDSRLEIIHQKLGLLEGAAGFQSSASDFSANGSEAFLPSTKTYNNSGFLFEEIPLEKIRLQFGARLDHQSIKAKETINFSNNISREDLTGSGSFGLIYKPIQGYAIAVSSSYTQRAPNAQELYSNGLHTATKAFEIGNKNLDIQKSKGIDLSLRKETGKIKGELNLFYNHFQDFITSLANGNIDQNSNSPIYNYVNLNAEFYGAEAKTELNVYDKNAHKLSFEVRGDYVEARNSDTKKPLPRIAPLRVGSSAIYKYLKIGLRLDTDYTFAQTRITQFERKTDGFLMVNAGLDYKINAGNTSSLLYVKATNLLNEDARNHTSLLKDVAPLAGRSIMIGIRTMF